MNQMTICTGKQNCRFLDTEGLMLTVIFVLTNRYFSIINILNFPKFE